MPEARAFGRIGGISLANITTFTKFRRIWWYHYWAKIAGRGQDKECTVPREMHCIAAWSHCLREDGLDYHGSTEAEVYHPGERCESVRAAHFWVRFHKLDLGTDSQAQECDRLGLKLRLLHSSQPASTAVRAALATNANN